MRQGITPVVAIVLLLMMTVAAAGGGYAWITQVQEEAQQETDSTLATGVELRDLSCFSHEISFAATNTGDEDLAGTAADVYIYDSNDELVTSDTVDISGSGFQAAGGFGTASTYLAENISVARGYRVEIDIGDDGATMSGRCDATYPPTCREIREAGFSTGDGTYTIDPDGVTGGANGFPVHCEMDAQDGGYTRLNLRNDAHTGGQGVCFGQSSCNWAANSEANWGMGGEWFQDTGSGDDGNVESHQCEVFAIGDATLDTYGGATTLWDYYDANGNPVPPAQIAALDRQVVNGTYYNGTFWVNDIDGPFPDGGDGDMNAGTNAFNIRIDPAATHVSTGGGPIVLWFSNRSDMDAGTTHALGSDRDSGETGTSNVTWGYVHEGGVPMFMGAKVDNDDVLYSTFLNGCDQDWGSTFELREAYVYVR